MSPQPSTFKNYMLDLVKNTMEYRETNNVARNDFIQLLMQLRNTGKVDEDNNTAFASVSKTGSSKALTLGQCTAQVSLLFFN